jgi:hypothetical protein
VFDEGIERGVGPVLLRKDLVKHVMDVVADADELLLIIADCYDDSSNT